MVSRLLFCAPFLAVLAAEDLRRQRIPNAGILLGAAAALGWHLAAGKAAELPARLGTAAAVLLVLGGLYRRDALGAGDVKAVWMLALWFPAEELLPGLLWGLSAALPPALLAPAPGERPGERWKMRLGRRLPLMPAFAAGLAGELIRRLWERGR